MDKLVNDGISVIVPVYNVEKYIARSIDSLLAQTFDNFEAILIDDGSTDKTGELCDLYAAKDSRIKVIHKENGGGSSARKAGIDAAIVPSTLIGDCSPTRPGTTSISLSISSSPSPWMDQNAWPYGRPSPIIPPPPPRICGMCR